MSEGFERTHEHEAEATVLKGELYLPLPHEIRPQAFTKLSHDGRYLAQRAKDFRLESAISFASAHTQVAGNREVKPGHGWSTLATSVVEDLNILEVITADRVVAQVSLEYPLVGYVPSITFLGTRFENLRIAGHKVDLDLNLDIFGEKPENDAPYTKDPGFVNRVCDQHERIQKHENPLEALLGRYNRLPASFENAQLDGESVECSLVNQAEGSYPGRTFGHVIHVPHFGVIYLAAVCLEQSDYDPESGTPRKTRVKLDMIRTELGCVASGKTSGPELIVGGRTKP
jgi:hypothetical protein